MNSLIEQELATAVRVEYNESTNEVYLVFLVTDEKFRQQIIKDWMQDLDVKLLGRKIVKI